eukprot:gnl/Ergobibamus_cyprinoides/3986.p2 GENE.gnl/Ergobibamus_cyprinoides/3986~~gnl/Ergobibamus_cyprinoides/3986.p2  ORF type:complete len:215 (-),score=13.84 gnl/Ergobibamus_cyprinoides/3986:198-842(-)
MSLSQAAQFVGSQHQHTFSPGNFAPTVGSPLSPTAGGHGQQPQAPGSPTGGSRYWAQDEHLRFVQCVIAGCFRWQAVAAFVVTRSPEQCRSHLNKHLQRLERIFGPAVAAAASTPAPQPQDALGASIVSALVRDGPLLPLPDQALARAMYLLPPPPASWGASGRSAPPRGAHDPSRASAGKEAQPHAPHVPPDAGYGLQYPAAHCSCHRLGVVL